MNLHAPASGPHARSFSLKSARAIAITCFALLFFGAASANAACPDDDILREAQGSLKKLAGMDSKSADADALQEIKESLKAVVDLDVSDLDPVCKRKAKRIRRQRF